MAIRQGDPGYVENRDEIVAALMAQLFGIGAGTPAGGQPYPYNLLGGNGAPGTPAGFGTGFTSSAPGHLSDTATNPDGTLGAVLGNPAAGMPSPGYNAPTTGDLTSASLNAPTGNFGPAQTGTPAGRSSVAGNVVDATATPTTTSTISPGYPATSQQFGPPSPTPDAFDIANGPMVAPTPTPSDLVAPTPTPNSVVASRFGEMQAPSAAPDNSGSMIAADIAGLSALNADVNAAVNAAYGAPGPVAGPTAAPTGAPASPDVAVGYGIGLGLGDSVGGGFGGATGDGTSGGYGGDSGGPGVGGASTGISGGPGGTGEGGANTGEGGTGVGTSGVGEGGGSGSGGGDGSK